MNTHQSFFSLWMMLTVTCSPPRLIWSPAESRHTTRKWARSPSLDLRTPESETFLGGVLGTRCWSREYRSPAHHRTGPPSIWFYPKAKLLTFNR